MLNAWLVGELRTSRDSLINPLFATLIAGATEVVDHQARSAASYVHGGTGQDVRRGAPPRPAAAHVNHNLHAGELRHPKHWICEVSATCHSSKRQTWRNQRQWVVEPCRRSQTEAGNAKCYLPLLSLRNPVFDKALHASTGVIAPVVRPGSAQRQAWLRGGLARRTSACPPSDSSRTPPSPGKNPRLSGLGCSEDAEVFADALQGQGVSGLVADHVLRRHVFPLFVLTALFVAVYVVYKIVGDPVLQLVKVRRVRTGGSEEKLHG